MYRNYNALSQGKNAMLKNQIIGDTLPKVKTNSSLFFSLLVMCCTFFTTISSNAQTNGIYESYAILSLNGGANAYYDMNATTANPDFQGNALGSFNTSNSLVVKGGQNKTFKCSGGDIFNGHLYWRVWLTSSGPSGVFNSVLMSFVSNDAGGCGGNQTWEGTGGATNIISGLTVPGNYTLEVYSDADGVPGTTFSSNGGNNYKANFNFCGPTSGALPVGNYAIPGCFATVNDAVAYINTNGVTGTGTVQFNIAAGGSETAPAGGIAIRNDLANLGTGTATTAIKFVKAAGAAYTITAPTPQVSGNLNDAIIKLIGADYITIDGLTLLENAANSTTTAGTNNMTEFGIALFYASASNGAQNNTFQNNTITLKRTYQNSFGIYSNTRHTATAVTTTADITAVSGANSFNKVYGNAINNVNFGSVFIGSGAPTASGFMDNGTDIGGASAITGNTYTNWGGIGTATSGYVGLTANNYCIFINNTYNDNISYNSITSAAAVSGLTVGGLLKNYSSGATVQPTGTITTNINNNTVTITNSPPGAAGSAIGLNNQGLTFLATATVNMNNNTVQNCVLGGTTVTSGGVTCITNLSVPGVLNMNGNSVINNAIIAPSSTTGTVVGIANSGACGTVNMNNNVVRSMASSATTGQMQGIINLGAVTTTLNINNNQLGNATSGFFSSSAAPSGALFGIVCAAMTNTCAVTIQNNDIRGISLATTAATSHYYINLQGTSSPFSQNISNNTFTNLNLNSSGSVLMISNFTSGAIPAGGSQTISGNSIVTGFNKTASGGNVFGITTTGVSSNATTSLWNNNNFSNITVTGTTGLSVISAADTGVVNQNITNNTVSNISGGTGAINGIVCTNGGGNGGNGNVISGNTVSTITSSGAVNGISYTAGTTSNIFKNKIYDLSALTATGAVNGISVSGGTTNTVYNNLVGNLNTPAASGATPLVGINISGGTTVNAYFNTVYLNGTSTDAVFGSSAVSAATSVNLTLKNNIFVNNSTSSGGGLAAAYRRSSTTLSTYQAGSNNNDFYGSTIFTDGTNTDATIAAYKTRVASNDSSSFSENPTFVSTVGSNANFLHINTSVATQIESGGAAVSGITDDFDGNTRDVATPDVGADEFNGVGADFLAPAITFIPNLVNPCNTTNRIITATISDASSVSSGATAPRIYFRKNGGAYSSAAGTLTSGTVDSGTWTFTITYATVGGVVVSDVIDYFVVAQDLLGNAGGNPSGGLILTNVNTVTTPPTSPLTYSIVGSLSGTYTVGAAGNYPTLTAAVNAYNTNCLGGPIVFQLIDAAYSASETFPITITANANSSATNTLTIRPSVGNAVTISGASPTSGVLKLNGADYVTIDGLNTGGSSLAVTNTSATNTSVVIWIGSADAGNGATNNAIKNCAISGATNITSVSGILAGSSVAFGSPAEAANSNNSIIGNTFKTTQNGIFVSGVASLDQNWVITNNTFGSTVAGEKHTYRGVYVGDSQNLTINNNTVAGVVSTATSTATMTGIQVGGTISGGTISRNKISNIKQVNTAGWGSNGIFLAASSTASALNVYNNFIFDVTGNGFTTANSEDNGYGIMIDSGGGYNIYYNTVSMNTNQSAAGSITAAINIDVSVTTPGAVNLRNNIFSNSQTIGNRYAIYNASSIGANVFAAINYNDYSAANVGFQTSARVTLANWQAASLSDANSKSVAPVFVNPSSDLHLIPASNTALDNFGTPIAGITTDYDNDARSATTPDMGADEFSNSSIINLKLFIEGYYVPVTGLMRPVNMNQGVGVSATDVETITVELHNPTAPYALAYTTTAMLKTNGDAVSTFTSAPSGLYYIVIRTRNAVDTWSATTQTVGGTTSYNFSSAPTQAFGSNMADMNGSGTYGFYSGDIDPSHDGNVDTIDYPVWETDSNNFESGVFSTDLNGDGNVDTIDYPIWENNSNLFISVVKP